MKIRREQKINKNRTTTTVELNGCIWRVCTTFHKPFDDSIWTFVERPKTLTTRGRTKTTQSLIEAPNQSHQQQKHVNIRNCEFGECSTNWLMIPKKFFFRLKRRFQYGKHASNPTKAMPDHRLWIGSHASFSDQWSFMSSLLLATHYFRIFRSITAIYPHRCLFHCCFRSP